MLIAHFLRAATPEGKPQYRLTGEAALALAPTLFLEMSASSKMHPPRGRPLPNAMITLDCLPP